MSIDDFFPQCLLLLLLVRIFVSYKHHQQRQEIKKQRQEIKKRLEHFISQGETLTPQEFFSVRTMLQGDIVGAYVIHNQTKDMYYVGQAKRLFFRVNQHFTGRGNAYVFADYHYGDAFTIQILPIANSGYSDLDALEKKLIEYYGAYSHGYNRTRGNGSTSKHC